VTDSYVPRRGDVICLEFDPQAGHEEAWRRSALTISPLEYNPKSGPWLVLSGNIQDQRIPVRGPASRGITYQRGDTG
jgi:mRNA interferase MazF